MNVGRRPRVRRLRSVAGSINSGRHILESRCAERCANDAFLTSFRATLNRVFSDVTRTPISTGMTARSQRIQRMAPFHDVTFKGCGALCARLATKRLLQHDTSCCKVSFGSAFDGFDLKFAPGDSEIP